MEQIRVPEAAPEWPSVELGIGEKRSFRKGSMSAFKIRYDKVSLFTITRARTRVDTELPSARYTEHAQ